MNYKCGCGFTFDSSEKGDIFCNNCGSLVCNDMNKLTNQLNRLDAIKQEIYELEQEKKRIELDLRIGLEGASYGYHQDWKIKYSSYVTKRFDSKKFKQENEDVYSKYLYEVAQDRLTISRTGEK